MTEIDFQIRLLDAIGKERDLLIACLYAIEDPVEHPYDRNNRSIPLLKRALLIDETDDGVFMPADNIVLLQSLVESSEYESAQILDIVSWKTDLKNSIKLFNETEESILNGVDNASDPLVYKRVFARECQRMAGTIRKRIRTTEEALAKSLRDNTKIESKITVVEGYLEQIQYLETDYFGRLTIDSILREVGDIPADFEGIFHRFTADMLKAREKSQNLLKELVEYNVKFKEQDEEMRNLKFLYERILKHGIPDTEALSDKEIGKFDIPITKDESAGNLNVPMDDLSFSEEMILDSVFESASKKLVYEFNLKSEILNKETFLAEYDTSEDVEFPDEYESLMNDLLDNMANTFINSDKEGKSYRELDLVEYLIDNARCGDLLSGWMSAVAPALFELSDALSDIEGFNETCVILDSEVDSYSSIEKVLNFRLVEKVA